MKSLLVILGIIISTIVFSQNTDFKPNNIEFSKEFIRLVDSTRTSIHGSRQVSYFNPNYNKNSKKSKRWITENLPFETIIDSNMSVACNHHNEYMYYLVIGEEGSPIINTHVEDSVRSGYKYKGTKKLLYNSQDRLDYYCGKGIVTSSGECVWGGYTKHDLYKNMTSKELAREAYKMFMESKIGHKDILINKSYTHCGVNLYVDPEFNTFKITFVTGTKKAEN